MSELKPSLRSFWRNDVSESERLRVSALAKSLLEHLCTDDICAKIKLANVLHKPSHLVQECILDFVREQGFQSEKKGLFSNYSTAHLRPDYYLELSPGRGVILEVERGKSLPNNMDLLDLWKCHICDHAQYLFLLVPYVRLDKHGKAMKIFDKVVDRLSPFFLERNYVNVDGLFIFAF